MRWTFHDVDAITATSGAEADAGTVLWKYGVVETRCCGNTVMWKNTDMVSETR